LPENNSEATEPGIRSKKPRWRIVFIAVLVILLGVLIVGNWFAGKPQGLGAKKGRLAGCPDSPNCVCSQDDRTSHHVAPFKYEGEGKAAFSRLAELLKTWPRARIVTQTDDYLHVEFTTPVLRFVDDVELLLADEDKLIHVRSASRVGRSDMGTNRKRVEAIRAGFGSASE
jgi:uncharacterized protein (DUF1499 family)